jgi:hypothetical protein
MKSSAVPSGRSVVCKLLAKEEEKKALSTRIKVVGIEYFSANITLTREPKHYHNILITGSIKALMFHGMYESKGVKRFQTIETSFDTKLLDTANANGLTFENEMDCDDEIVDGVIDVGEIASQYLCMEI